MKTSALAIASLVLGIVSMCFSIVPILNFLCYPISVVAIALGIGAFILIFMKKRAGLIMNAFGVGLATLALCVCNFMYTTLDAAVTEVIEESQITLTLADIESIEDGMAYDDVVALLGEPTTSNTVNGKNVCTWSEFGYVDSEAAYYTVSVTFGDDNTASMVLTSTDLK